MRVKHVNKIYLMASETHVIRKGRGDQDILANKEDLPILVKGKAYCRKQSLDRRNNRSGQSSRSYSVHSASEPLVPSQTLVEMNALASTMALAPMTVPEVTGQTLVGFPGSTSQELVRPEAMLFTQGQSTFLQSLMGQETNPFATYSLPFSQTSLNPGYTGDHFFHPGIGQNMAQPFWPHPMMPSFPYPMHLNPQMPTIPYSVTQGMGSMPFSSYTSQPPITQAMGSVDDLSQPYVPTTHTRFSARIANFAFPPKTKMPANVKTYDGLGDPDDHLELFSGAATIERWCLPLWCHMFSQTLVGPARLWFNSLPDGSIDTFEDLSRKFLANFVQQKRYTRDPVELHNIKQKEDEDLQAFMERYKLESLSIGGATEQMRVSGFIHGVRPRQLIEDLNRKIPKTMEEPMERTEAFVRGKEAAQVLDVARKPRVQPRKHSPPRSRSHRFQPFDRRQSHRPYESQRSYNRASYSPKGHEDEKDRQAQFTPLTKTPKEILATEEARFSFRPPKPLSKVASERNPTKYCDFHGETGHHTNDCFQLKKRIEAAVKSGELAHLVKDIKEKKTSGDKNDQGKDKGKKADILMVSQSGFPREKSTRKVKPWMHVKINFPPVPTPAKPTVPVIFHGVRPCPTHVEGELLYNYAPWDPAMTYP
ncbi:hypothetical protein E3N88_33015 [Mikania micrantha]|uniref:Retrotransposon gag domain-containing protein n=1 Tax=Mikania micrantha TaxID=192012 RepID=A0A5N6MA10_9ASTR|nr:hypothetical protein E3N88_33015 [Mikania micrantha]